jgi:hypothetical protein
VTTPPLCIYCRTPLGPETRRAHVIPQCLGGRLWSTTICCNDCNNAISPLENELCKALREPSAALRARDAENQPIRAQVEADGKTYDYTDGLGNLSLPAPEFKEGKLVFPLPGDPDKLADIIAHHLWRNGLTPGALDTGTIGIEPDQTFHIKPHPPERRMLFSRLEVGTPAQMRVVMKMALELLALLRPDDARRWDVLRPARLYVREGVDDGMLPARFDALSEAGLFQADEVPRLSHAVEVCTNRQNLHYRVTFFGGLHVTGSLSTRWNGSAFCIGHALDPQKPGRYVTKNAESDGPALGLYHPGLKKQAFDKFEAWFMARTLEISDEATSRPWKAPGAPDLVALRPAIEEKFAALLKRKRQPRPPKKKSKS